MSSDASAVSVRPSSRRKEAAVELVVGRGPVTTHEVKGGNGLRLHVREWGDPACPAVLFVHGWSQSQFCWARQYEAPELMGFRLVTLDLRGHGMSDKPLEPDQYADAQAWADDIAAVVDQMGLDRPILVGWSYGGFAITDYVRACGDSEIAGIVFAGGAVLLKPPSFDHIGPGFLENAEGACSGDLATSIPAMCRFLRACTAQPLADKDWSAALAWNMVVPPEVRGALIAREIDGDDALGTLSVPLLAAHGRADTIVLPSMTEHVLAVCPTAKPSWYDGVGHMPFWEDTPRFNRELVEFVGNVG
jgi:pimeloyl-ACP methyl ester carboxylesterase